MPDIDLDFCFERRGEVIEYVRERYGRESVGQIITFGTMKARAAFRDVARTLRLENGEVDRTTKLIPAGPGGDVVPGGGGAEGPRARGPSPSRTSASARCSTSAPASRAWRATRRCTPPAS